MRPFSRSPVAALDAVNPEVALIDLAAHGGRTERHVAAKDGNDRSLAFPALAADRRVAQANLYAVAVPGIDETQQAVEHAVKILRRAHAHVLGGKAAEEAVGESMQIVAMRHVCAPIDELRYVVQQALLERFPRHVATLSRCFNVGLRVYRTLAPPRDRGASAP
jgi:hypothetical protein